MPNLKPTTRIDVIGNLDLSPEKDPGFFIESKQQKKFLIKPPNWDSAGDSIELLAIQNEREYQAMLKLQRELLENAKFQGEINSNRVQEIYQLHSHLRRRFATVNTFMKDCDSKKRVAEKKITEEQERQAELKKVIEKYKNDIEVLTKFRDTLSETVKDFEPYEKVISEVIAKTDAWSSVKDCTDRCDALMLAQTEIATMEKEKIQEIEAKREQMVRMASEAALTALGFINELSELERDYDKARSECLKWEKILANIKDYIAENKLTKKRMFDGIQLMYRDLCKRRGINPVHKKYDIEQQLDFIKNEIEILQIVVEECKKG